MPIYTVKNSPLKRGGEIIPIGGSVELTDKETIGLEQFLDLALDQSGQKSAPLNVAQTVQLVMAAETLEALAILTEGEARKGVLDAIAKRQTELAPQ